MAIYFVGKTIFKLMFHILKFKQILKTAVLRFQCWYRQKGLSANKTARILNIYCNVMFEAITVNNYFNY